MQKARLWFYSHTIPASQINTHSTHLRGRLVHLDEWKGLLCVYCALSVHTGNSWGAASILKGDRLEYSWCFPCAGMSWKTVTFWIGIFFFFFLVLPPFFFSLFHPPYHNLQLIDNCWMIPFHCLSHNSVGWLFPPTASHKLQLANSSPLTIASSTFPRICTGTYSPARNLFMLFIIWNTEIKLFLAETIGCLHQLQRKELVYAKRDCYITVTASD